MVRLHMIPKASASRGRPLPDKSKASFCSIGLFLQLALTEPARRQSCCYQLTLALTAVTTRLNHYQKEDVRGNAVIKT